jgi:hypothetical protein
MSNMEGDDLQCSYIPTILISYAKERYGLLFF